MATLTEDQLFAPPTEEELMAPPSEEELGSTAGSSTPEQENLFAPPTEQELSSVDKEIEERSFWDRPVLGAEETKQSEIEQIARKHGVPAKDLEELAPYFGARMEGAGFISEPELKRAAGAAGSLALNIPQKLYKKFQTPEMEAALDDVQNLASGRQSYTQIAAETALPAVGIGGKAATTAGRVAGGAATGAAAGYAGSSKEQELEGTLFGAGLGGAATALIGKLSRGAAKELPQTEQRVIERNTQNLGEGTQEVLSRRTGSEQDLLRSYSGMEPLDDVASRRIVEEQLDPEFVKQIKSPDTEEGVLFRRKLEKDIPDASPEELEKLVDKKLAEEVLERRTRDFAEELTGERSKSLQDARQAIEEFSKRQGAENTAARWKLSSEENAAMDYIKDRAVRFGRGDNAVDRGLNMLSDAQFVLRDIDERAGTNLEEIHRQLNSGVNRMSFARAEARKDLDTIFRSNKAIDQEIMQGGKIYQALDSGDFSQLSPAEQKAAGQFRQYFDKYLNYVNGLVKEKDPSINPLSIPKRENYVPHQMLPTEKLLEAVNERVQQVKDLVRQTMGRNIQDLSELSSSELKELSDSRPMAQLLEAVRTFDAKPVRSAADLSARLKDTFASREGRLNLETKARAALERSGNIPDWMREKNLYRLADSWTSSTLKHLYLRQQMGSMASIARRLEKAGADLEAKYVKNLLADINGIRRGTMAERLRQGELKYQQWVDSWSRNAKGPAAKGVAAVAKAIPTILGDLNRQIYPNLLGLSPRSILMNATQTIAKTAPELGGQYGYSTLVRGAAHAALNRKSIMQRLEKEGFVPAEFVGKYRQAVTEGIRRSALYAIPNEALNAMGNAAMFLYTRMDAINRAITLGTADMMARDLQRGSRSAQAALRRFPSTVQRAVSQAGSEQEVARILGSHLNAATQYNYNRASMSEFGRVMGPLFSTFSKWPTATAGEMIQEMRNKGTLRGSLRNAEKYVAPLLLFQAADYLISGGDEDSLSDRQKKFLGASGLSQAAPIGSVSGILKGDFFTPPAVDAVVQSVVLPAISGDSDMATDKVRLGLASAIQNFTPGSGYVRFLTDDLPTIITGERPEGKDFLERTQSGIERATR